MPRPCADGARVKPISPDSPSGARTGRYLSRLSATNLPRGHQCLQRQALLLVQAAVRNWHGAMALLYQQSARILVNRSHLAPRHGDLAGFRAAPYSAFIDFE